jgi:hypothetical protein
MPVLSYSVSDFTAFTKIRSADVNARFTDIKTLLNTTKLDDDNLANAGITRGTKLKTGTARAVVVNDGSGVMSEALIGTGTQVFRVTSGAPAYGYTPVASKTADATLTTSEEVVLVDCNGANRTITLPAAASITGKFYKIKKTDSGAFSVTVDGNASETIDGATTIKLWSQYDSISIVSDGTNWALISADIKVGCSLVGNASTASMTTATDTKLIYGSTATAYDTHGAYNTTTGVYTAPLAGTYTISVGLILSGGSNGTTYFRLYKGGVAETGFFGPANTATSIQCGSTQIRLAAGDTLEVYFQQNSGSARTTTTPAAYNALVIARVGE